MLAQKRQQRFNAQIAVPPGDVLITTVTVLPS
jgi:hypothetical protein